MSRQQYARYWGRLVALTLAVAALGSVGYSLKELYADGPSCIDYVCNNNGECQKVGCHVCSGVDFRCGLIPGALEP